MASSNKKRSKRVTGKIGPTVSYVLNGKEVVRTIGKRTTPFSNLEIASQQELKIMQLFCNIIYGFVRLGFELEAKAKRLNPQNVFMSQNKRAAIAGLYPDIFIDFSKVLVSKGKLHAAVNPKATIEDGKVKFTWEYTFYSPGHHWSDQVMMLVYMPEIEQTVYVTAGPYRDQEVAYIDLPTDVRYSRMETYIAFIKEDRKQVSNSCYTGMLNK